MNSEMYRHPVDERGELTQVIPERKAADSTRNAPNEVSALRQELEETKSRLKRVERNLAKLAAFVNRLSDRQVDTEVALESKVDLGDRGL